MSHKNFSLGLIAAFISLTVFVWVLSWGMPEQRYLNADYPFLRQQHDHVMQDSDIQETIILGDSRTKMGILACDLGDNTHNLSLSGASAIEMYYTLKNYLKHHPQPKAIVVSLAPEHFTSIGTYPNGSAYLQFFTRDELDEINSLLLAYDNKDFRTTTTCFYYRTPNVYMWPVLKGLFQPRTKEFNEVYAEAMRTHGFMPGKREVDMEKVVAPEVKEGKFRLDPVVDIYMNKLLTLSVERNIPVYVIQMPMGKDGHKILTESGYLRDYADYMECLKQAYDIKVQTDIPVFDNQYFGDNSHLNRRGADLFTEKLKQKFWNIF